MEEVLAVLAVLKVATLVLRTIFRDLMTAMCGAMEILLRETTRRTRQRGHHVLRVGRCFVGPTTPVQNSAGFTYNLGAFSLAF